MSSFTTSSRNLSLSVRHKAIAWDPKSPSTLLLPSSSSSFQTFLSHDGTGCNTNETSALIKILNVRDDYYNSLSPYEDDEDEEGKKRIQLSKEYRRALQSCLQEWEERLASSSSPQEDDDDNDNEEEENNLELLKLMYAITHLSEIYLLPTTSITTTSSSSSSGGAVTANTIKYLRLHHMSSPYDEYTTEEIEEMLSSSQPEYYNTDNRDVTMYWSLLQKLTIRGYLEDVWSILSRHSSCRRCVAAETNHLQEEGYDYEVIKEDRDGFAILHALLLSAPLPGGRNEFHDDGLTQEDDENKQQQQEEEIEEALEEMLMEGIPRSSYKLWDSSSSSSSSSNRSTTRDVPTQFNPRLAYSLHTHWIDSIKTALSSYSPLQALCKRIPKLYTHILSIIISDDDYIVQQQPNNNNIFESWSEALCTELLYKRPLLRREDVHVRTSRQIEAYGGFSGGQEKGCGFEEIVLSVMRGNAGRVVEALHDLGGGSGAALPATMTALLCNLLTEANQIQPAIPTSPNDTSESFNIQTELLLSASHSIISSFSTTTTTTATSSSNDVGVSLATRLLLPHTKPSFSSKDYTRITSQVACNLDTHSPSNDSSTKILLNLCKPLIQKGSLEILKSCESLCFTRYKLFHKEQKIGGIVYWLLRGMELYNNVLSLSPLVVKEKNDGVVAVAPTHSSSPSYRNFVQLCTSSAELLLKALVENQKVEDVAYYLNVGQKIVEAIQEDEEKEGKEEDGSGFSGVSSISSTVSKYREVKLLHCIVNIATSMMKENDEDIARYVIKCLEECVISTARADEEKEDEGVVLTLAHPNMYDDLLCLAYSVLESEEIDENSDPAEDDKDESEVTENKAAFDVHGIHILMARLSQLIEWDHFDSKRLSPTDEDEQDNDEEENDDDDNAEMMNEDDETQKSKKDTAATTKLTYTVPQMRLSLCKGLGRAFVSENAKKNQQLKKSSSVMSEDVKELNASFMALGREERSVELMFAPTM